MESRDQNTELASTEIVAPEATKAPTDIEMLQTLEEPADAQETKEQKEPPTPFQDSLRRLRQDTRAMISLGFIILFVLIPLIGPVIYQHIGGAYNSPTSGVITPDVYHSPFHQELSLQDQGPSGMYWLGTDAIGRDILARLMQGMLVSIFVAVVVEIIDIAAGITIGVLAGFYGGWIDQILARFTDVMFAFPTLLFVLLISGIFGQSADVFFSKVPIVGANGQARLILVSIVLAFTIWPLMARYVRGQTLQLKQQQFVEAARTAGTSNVRIILRHIIPNLFNIVIVASTLNIANTIVGEAGLSFLGLGVQSPGSSIGIMISDALPQLETHPWEALVPSIVLTIIVLAFSFLGDGLRDAFDPRTKD